MSSGPCTFVGFLVRGKDGSLVAVDEDGKNPEPIRQGDIMADPRDLRRPD